MPALIFFIAAFLGGYGIAGRIRITDKTENSLWGQISMATRTETNSLCFLDFVEFETERYGETVRETVKQYGRVVFTRPAL